MRENKFVWIFEIYIKIEIIHVIKGIYVYVDKEKKNMRDTFFKNLFLVSSNTYTCI